MITIAGGILIALFVLYLLAYAIGHGGATHSLREPEDPLLAAERRRYENRCHQIGEELFKSYVPVVETEIETRAGAAGRGS